MTDRRAELRATIAAAYDSLASTLDGIGADEWRRPSPNEGWTAKDTLAHLTTIDERIRGMVRSALDGSATQVEDIDVFNARKVEERHAWSVAQLRAELEQQRATSLALFDRTGADDLDRPFEHPRRGRVTVEQLWRIIPNHIAAHLRDIEAARAGA
ncbi:MAG: DinB family protein [Chloroflexi bacterium]|nr:DinB family protein [Chloroflexota bacterium]